MNENVKYKIIYEKLLKRLQKMQAEEKLPSVRTMLSEYKVSLATLNSALDILKGSGLITMVPYRGIYKSNSFELSNKRKKVVTLMLPGHNEILFAKIISCCHRFFGMLNFKLNLVVYDLNREAECESLQNELDADETAGVIYMPTFDSVKTVALLRQLNSVKPVVQIDRKIGNNVTSAVGYKLFEDSYKATEILIEQGCSRIGLVAPVDKLPGQSERIAGFKAALKNYGIVYNPAFDINYNSMNLNVATNMNELFASKYRLDGLFATNSVFIPRLFHKLAELGVKVPDDIAVTTFDLSEVFERLPFFMTHINEPVVAVVERAVEILAKTINEGCQVNIHESISGNLVQGNTCRISKVDKKELCYC